MKSVFILMTVLLSASAVIGQTKYPMTSFSYAKRTMDSLDALCDKTGKVSAHPHTRKGEVNYYSSKNDKILHTVKFDYDGNQVQVIHIYEYDQNLLSVAYIGKEIVLLNWRKNLEGESEMLKLNDTLRIWNYRASTWKDAIKFTEPVEVQK